MRRPFRLLSSLAPLLALTLAGTAQASVVHGMRDYFESLGGVYAVQQTSNSWTFHTQSHAGAMLTPGVGDYRGPVSPQQIGQLVNTGTSGCTPGYCGAVPSQTLATFDGVFVHPGSPDATVAVFHADAAMQLDEIRLLSEMVGNGENGNGMTVQVRAIIGGAAQDLGSFLLNYALSAATAIDTLYTPGLQLGAGDSVEVRYGPNGSYLYDHGNVDIRITTSTATQPPGQGVPEPQSVLLAALGLLALRATRQG